MGGGKSGLSTDLWRLGSGALQKLKLNLVDFSQTKNTCSGNPPNNLDTYDISKTGATQNYIKFSTPCSNNTAAENSLQVILLYGSFMQATQWEELDLIPILTTRSRTSHIFNHLQTGYLISIGQLCHDVCTVTLTTTHLPVYNQVQNVI